MLPGEEAFAVLGTTGVFGRIGAGAERTSVFAAGADDAGSAGDAALAGMVSTGLTSLLAALPLAVAGVDDAVAVTAGTGGGVIASTVGCFAEATDAAGDGQR